MRNLLKNRIVKLQKVRSKKFKKSVKKFGGSEFFCNFAIPKLEQKAPNQLSFNELGTKWKLFKH